MTEDRAKNLLCQMYLPQFDKEEKEALTTAIEALEEIQRYKRIGTPEYIIGIIDTQLGGLDIVDVLKKLIELKKYQELGTIEEFHKLKMLFGDNFTDMSEPVRKILKEYPGLLKDN